MKKLALVVVGSSLQLAAGFAKADDADAALEELRRIHDRQSSLIAASPVPPENFEIKSLEASRILSKLGRNLKVVDPGDVRTSAQQYVTFFDNQSSTMLRIVVFFARSDSKEVLSVEGRYSPGQVAPFMLGTCFGLKAYIVETYVPGEPVPVISTDLQFPDLSSGERCHDFAGIAALTTDEEDTATR